MRVRESEGECEPWRFPTITLWVKPTTGRPHSHFVCIYITTVTDYIPKPTYALELFTMYEVGNYGGPIATSNQGLLSCNGRRARRKLPPVMSTSSTATFVLEGDRVTRHG